LWGKAFTEIKKSPCRLLFGTGPGSHQVLDFSGEVWYSRHLSQFWSWDNQYAIYLLELGFCGFVLWLILYLNIIIRAFNIWINIETKYKGIVLGIFSSIIVFIFMMTNVAIFTPQLQFIFWSLVVTINIIRKENKVFAINNSCNSM
jgi:O-antigen ligase